MTIAHEFAYVAPSTLDEALAVLARHDGGARLLAGGTDLVASMRDEAIAPEVVVDLKRIAGLDLLTYDEGHLHVGCLITFTDLIESATVRTLFPLLWEMAGMVASTGIRNRATVAGNICSAVPSCDAGPALLVHQAEVHLVGPGGWRVVPVTEWFTGPRRTAIGSDEIVVDITVPMPANPHGAAFARLTRYAGEDLAQASVAVLATTDHGAPAYRVAFGAVAATPVRAPRIEAALAGRPVDDVSVAAARELVAGEIHPITDVRATERYRARMCEVMLERALRAAGARRSGGGPAYGTRLM